MSISKKPPDKFITVKCVLDKIIIDDKPDNQLKKDDIGLIDVKDFSSFVAIRKSKISGVLALIKDEKIKNKKVKIAIAK
jgi:hypothetical protein